MSLPKYLIPIDDIEKEYQNTTYDTELYMKLYSKRAKLYFSQIFSEWEKIEDYGCFFTLYNAKLKINVKNYKKGDIIPKIVFEEQFSTNFLESDDLDYLKLNDIFIPRYEVCKFWKVDSDQMPHFMTF